MQQLKEVKDTSLSQAQGYIYQQYSDKSTFLVYFVIDSLFASCSG